MRLSLKSTTSLVLSLSLATPVMAQDAQPFPCVTGDGQTVNDASQFSNALIASLATQAAANPGTDAAAACSADAYAQALAEGGDPLAAALATASAETRAALIPAGSSAAPAEPTAEVATDPAATDPAAADAAAADQAAADQAAADQAAADQAAADQVATDQAAADQAVADQAAADQAAADQAATDQAAADQAATDQTAANQAAADQAATDQAAADQADADQAVADQAAADQAVTDQAAADQTAADQATADQAVTDQTAADQTAPADDSAPSDAAAAAAAIAAQSGDAPATDAAPQTDAATADAAPADAAPTSTIETDTTAETATPPATTDTAPATADAAPATTDTAPAAADAAPAATDAAPAATADAQAPQLTAEEQAARDAERQAARESSAAAAATSADLVDDPAVVTEDVTEDDVRAANQDFETSVTGDAAAATTTGDAPVTAENTERGGLSTFEKALVLGLGAVAVGAILKNGDRVVSNSGDRVVVQRDGELRVLKNDDVLLRQPGAQLATRTFDDGSTLSTVTRDDGSVVTTIRAADGTVLRRSLTRADGTEVALINDLDNTTPVQISSLPPVPQETVSTSSIALSDQAALQAALTASLRADTGRTYSLEQVRDIRQVRALAPQVELAAVTFETGSAAIQQNQADELASLGGAIRQIVADDPSAVFLVEGHTDAVGDAGYNLALSDRRAETVALALSQYFQVPPENLVTQGYGEQFLKVDTQSGERVNRRAAVRNISELLQNS